MGKNLAKDDDGEAEREESTKLMYFEALNCKDGETEHTVCPCKAQDNHFFGQMGMGNSWATQRLGRADYVFAGCLCRRSNSIPGCLCHACSC